MIIDINELNDKSYEKKDINIQLERDNFFDGGEIVAYSEPIKFDGFLRRKRGVLELIGDVDTEVLLNCSRCMKVFPYKINIHIEEELSNTEDCEIISIQADNIDMYEIIENSIMLELPVKRLCKDNCKGLCQTCGKDLNLGQCSCADLYVDPRLEKLTKMFSDYKEV
ncbi:DUF177 domain-containing protein [Clostridium sp.]